MHISRWITSSVDCETTKAVAEYLQNKLLLGLRTTISHPNCDTSVSSKKQKWVNKYCLFK